MDRIPFNKWSQLAAQGFIGHQVYWRAEQVFEIELQTNSAEQRRPDASAVLDRNSS